MCMALSKLSHTARHFLRGSLKKNWITSFALAVAVTLSTGLKAQTFDKSIDAYQRGDYRVALAGFKALAEQGDAPAQSNLGLMYEKGMGVTQDFPQAMRWYRKAADQGVAIAQSNLAC